MGMGERQGAHREKFRQSRVPSAGPGEGSSPGTGPEGASPERNGGSQPRGSKGVQGENPQAQSLYGGMHGRGEDRDAGQEDQSSPPQGMLSPRHHWHSCWPDTSLQEQ